MTHSATQSLVKIAYQWQFVQNAHTRICLNCNQIYLWWNPRHIRLFFRSLRMQISQWNYHWFFKKKIIPSVPETVYIATFWFTLASHSSNFFCTHTDLSQRKDKVIFFLPTLFANLHINASSLAWVERATRSCTFICKCNTFAVLST